MRARTENPARGRARICDETILAHLHDPVFVESGCRESGGLILHRHEHPTLPASALGVVEGMRCLRKWKFRGDARADFFSRRGPCNDFAQGFARAFGMLL